MAAAANAKELTWQDVFVEAKANNPTLKKSVETLKQARLNYYSAYTNFLPDFSANASASQSQSDSSGFGRSYSYGLSGSLSLFSGFSDVAGVKGQSASLKIAEAGYERILANTVFSLKTSFINLLSAQESVQLSKQILDKRSQNYELVKLKYDSGTQDKGSLIRVEADRDSAQFNLDKAQRALKLSSLQLSRTMGRNDFEVITVTGSFSYDSSLLELDVNSLVEKTPEFISALYSLEKSKADLLSAESGLYPSLNLSGSTSKNGPDWAPENNSWNLGLSLNYPFFPGGKNIYNVKIARSGRTEAEEALIETRQQLEVNLNSAYNNFLDAAGSVRVSEKYLEASREQSDIITTQYINGLETYYNWYAVENDYINSLSSLLNSRQNALIQQANFIKTAGRMKDSE